ncbi:MAG: prolyl oligopeptidase family serine peptidase [Crocinitomix sp.]|nr:prolyl oligopeptidase family serine peptidase [Crocinitomix sp.]
MTRIFALVVFTCIFHGVFAQVFQGRILSSEGEALPFAKVELKKFKIQTRTDYDGAFRISLKNQKIPFTDTIIVTYIGYETYRKAVKFKGENTEIEISLKEDSKMLNSVTIRTLKDYPAEEVVRFALKNVKDNYPKNTTNCQGFYREQIEEENDWVILNEAALELNYGKYPQKGYQKKAFKAYRNLDELPWNISKHSVFRHLIYFPSYISVKNDQVKLLSARSSSDFGKYNVFSSPIGGPLDLLALDKIKYQSDFLDPKLLKKYTYKNEKQERFNNELCYVIRFYPNEEYQEPIFHALSEKMQSPIYVGKMYIAGKDFAVIHIEYEFADNIDLTKYTFFNGKIGLPENVYVKIDYQKYEDGWILKSVEAQQKRHYKIDFAHNAFIDYECVRSLNLNEFKESKTDFDEDSLIFLTKSFHINDYASSYDNEFWKEYKNNKTYVPLDIDVRKQLESRLSLDQQFNNINLPLDSLKVPLPKKIKTSSFNFADTLVDFYQWMEDSNDSNLIHYLLNENLYFESVLNKLKTRNVRLFQRKLNSLFNYDSVDVGGQKSEADPFQVDNGYSYRVIKNGNGLHLITKVNEQHTDTLMNISNFVQGKINFNLEQISFGNNGDVALSYSEKGGYSASLLIQKQKSNPYLIDSIADFVWVNDSSLLYTKKNEKLRGYQVRLFNINNAKDSLIIEERNEEYMVSLYPSVSRDLIWIESRSLNANYFYSCHTNTADLTLNQINSPEDNNFVTVEHYQGKNTYVSTNFPNGKNELAIIDLESEFEPYKSRKVVYTTDKLINEFLVTENHIALTEYALNKFSLTTLTKDDYSINHLSFDEEIKALYLEDENNNDENIGVILSSPKTPYREYDINLEKKEKKSISQVGLNEEMEIQIENRFIPSNDSIEVPLMVISNKAFHKDSIKGVILKAYGAYGYPEFPNFTDEDIVFANLGFVVAYTYVRGGGELGQTWHNSGKGLQKKNTFEDYVLCANYLKSFYQIDSKQMVGYGSSAGGLIMGYVANNHPELFGTLIFDRPFLDVVNIMSDSSDILTALEYSEWGNPLVKVDYEYIKTYSPYQNIRPQAYPNMLFLGGYYDRQAPYWQIAKSVAQYRDNNISNSLILMKMNLQAGHKGLASGSDSNTNLSAIASLVFYTLNGE